MTTPFYLQQPQDTNKCAAVSPKHCAHIRTPDVPREYTAAQRRSYGENIWPTGIFSPFI